MIKIKLAALMAKLEKSAAEIARETKINRNTIMSLVKGRIDGLKFPTLDKLCAAYGWKIEDILEFVPDVSENELSDGGEVYRQEGEGTPYFMWPGMIACRAFNNKYFSRSYPVVDFFAHKDYFLVYFYKDQLSALAREIYREHGNKEKIELIYTDYLQASQKIIETFNSVTKNQVAAFNNQELYNFATKIAQDHFQDWTLSIFIDSFDAGFDQQEIQRLAKKHRLSAEEVYILLTPAEATFNNEKKLDLMRIADIFKQEGRLKKTKSWRGDPLIKEHIRRFSYYKSNYARYNPLTEAELIKEILSLRPSRPAFKKEYENLKNYQAKQTKAIAAILKKHRLKDNPLFFFQKLTYMREYRKMMNLMYFVLADYVLDALEIKTGLAKKYLKYLNSEEIGLALSGSLGLKQLQERRDEGMFTAMRPEGYKIFLGAQAQSLKNEWEQKLKHKNAPTDIIYGQVASQGYVRGRAKIILGEDDFAKFQDGEILISGMTRPEFLPLIKKASAIVTNEGGITCHAAIVSRELNKPCIIGTKIATELIRDNDLIEVRANHGTVRIIQRA